MQLLLGLWMNFTDYHLSRVQKWISLANRATSLRIFIQSAMTFRSRFLAIVVVVLLTLNLTSNDLTLVPRRVGLGVVASCGCAPAWADVGIRKEMPLSRGRQDEDFARGMAFGILGKMRKMVLIADMSIFCMVKSCF